MTRNKPSSSSSPTRSTSTRHASLVANEKIMTVYSSPNRHTKVSHASDSRFKIECPPQEFRLAMHSSPRDYVSVAHVDIATQTDNIKVNKQQVLLPARLPDEGNRAYMQRLGVPLGHCYKFYLTGCCSTADTYGWCPYPHVPKPKN